MNDTTTTNEGLTMSNMTTTQRWSQKFNRGDLVNVLPSEFDNDGFVGVYTVLRELPNNPTSGYSSPGTDYKLARGDQRNNLDNALWDVIVNTILLEPVANPTSTMTKAQAKVLQAILDGTITSHVDINTRVFNNLRAKGWVRLVKRHTTHEVEVTAAGCIALNTYNQ